MSYTIVRNGEIGGIVFTDVIVLRPPHRWMCSACGRRKFARPHERHRCNGQIRKQWNRLGTVWGMYDILKGFVRRSRAR